MVLLSMNSYSDMPTWETHTKIQIYTKTEKNKTPFKSPILTQYWVWTLNVTASSTDVHSRCCSNGPICKPTKVHFLRWPWVRLAALEKKLWSFSDIHQLAWTILGGRKQTGSSDHLSLWLMLHSILDLACGSWTDASLSSPDILGRQADMHRHQTWQTEKKSTCLHFKQG